MSPPNSSQNRPPGKLRLSSSRFGATAPHTQYFCLFICLLPDPDWKPWSTETLSVLFPSHWTPRSNKERGPSWMLRNILSSSVRWWQKHVSDWWRGSAWCSRESRPSLRCVVIGKAPDRPPPPRTLVSHVFRVEWSWLISVDPPPSVWIMVIQKLFFLYLILWTGSTEEMDKMNSFWPHLPDQGFFYEINLSPIVSSCVRSYSHSLRICTVMFILLHLVNTKRNTA